MSWSFFDFFFLRKGCFSSFICNYRHEVSDNGKLILFERPAFEECFFLFEVSFGRRRAALKVESQV